MQWPSLFTHCTRVRVHSVYLLWFGLILILIVRRRSSQSGHLVDDSESSQLVQENISTFIHQVPDDLQSQQVTIIVVLKQTFNSFTTQPQREKPWQTDPQKSSFDHPGIKKKKKKKQRPLG